MLNVIFKLPFNACVLHCLSLFFPLTFLYRCYLEFFLPYIFPTWILIWVMSWFNPSLLTMRIMKHYLMKSKFVPRGMLIYFPVSSLKLGIVDTSGLELQILPIWVNTMRAWHWLDTTYLHDGSTLQFTDFPVHSMHAYMHVK